MLKKIPMKVFIPCIIVLLIGLSVPIIRDSTNAHASDSVAITSQDALQYPWLGFGAQYGNVERSLTDAQWNTLSARINYLQPGIVRTTDDFGMCVSSGCPTYDWQSPSMLSWYHMLDTLKNTNTVVVIGTWHVPAGVDFASTQFAQIQADFLQHMIVTMGYTNIKYYHTPNEADCNYSGQTWTNNTISQWETAVNNLYAALSSDNLLGSVSIAGPDSCGDRWNSAAPSDEQNHLGAYEWHHYDANASNGNEEGYLRNQLQMIDQSGIKPVFLGEMGVGDADSGAVTGTYQYGLDMADYGIQIARSGLSGASAWCFDDTFFGSKQCGMSDVISGTLKPWFYSWSLLARYFRPGSTIYAPSVSTSGLRVVAAQESSSTSSTTNWTLAMVNENSTAETLAVNLPGSGSINFDQYNYVNGQRSVDSNGYPTPTTTVQANLGSDMNVTVPADSMILLTTLASTGPLGVGTSSQSIHSVSVTTGETPTPIIPTPIPTPDPSVVSSLAPGTQTTITDNLTDWSKTFSHTQNLVFDTIHDSWFENDPSRVKRYSSATQNFVYHYQAITNFQARVYLNSPQAVNTFTVDTSPDGNTWTTLALKTTPITEVFNKATDTTTTDISNIYATTYTPSTTIPTGTQYIRLSLGNDTIMWIPQVGNVTLSVSNS